MVPFSRNLLTVLLALCGLSSAYCQKERIQVLEKELASASADTTRLRLYQALATAYSSVDPSKKMAFARRYGKLAKTLERDSIVAESYIDIGISHGIRSKMDSAVFYFKKALDLSKSEGYVRGRARSLACLGYSYDMLDRTGDAIACYKEALTIYKSLKNVRGINQCLTNIGSLYFDMEQCEQARSYFGKVLESYRKAKDESGIAYALFTLGNTDLELLKYDDAEREFNESLKIRTKLGDVAGIGMTNWGLGKLATRRKNYPLARKHLDIALKNIREVGDPYQEGAVLLTYSKVWKGMGEYEKAEQCTLKTLELARQNKNKAQLSVALEQLTDIYEAAGDLKNAFRYQKEYIAVRDSMNVEKARQDIVQAEANRIQSENDTLEKDNELISSRSNSYFKTIVVGSALFVFLTLLLLLYYRRNREVRIMNRLLEEQKEETAAINAELEAQNRLGELQNKELEKLNHVKNKFFSIVSHDLRSPMSTLQMLFALYREGQLKEMDVHETLLKLEDTIYTTNEFLDNLLEWAKNQLDGITVKPEIFELSELADKNIRLIHSKIRIKNLSVINNVKPGCTAFADPNMIDVVMRNLLSNSVKFCHTGDTVTVDCMSDENSMTFAVSDSGPGISEAEMQRLFSLEHVVSVGSSGETGHQIGLILCRDMVELNNGKIRVESELGKGTRIFVTLPKRA